MDEASKLRGNLAIADFAIKDYKAKITALEAENAALRAENERLRGIISDLVYRGNDVQDCLDALVGNTNLDHDAYTEVCKVQEKWDIAVTEGLERSE